MHPLQNWTTIMIQYNSHYNTVEPLYNTVYYNMYYHNIVSFIAVQSYDVLK